MYKIVFDTNIIEQRRFYEALKNLTDFIVKNKIEKKVMLCVPEIVSQEWQIHREQRGINLRKTINDNLKQLEDYGHEKLVIKGLDFNNEAKRYFIQIFKKFKLEIFPTPKFNQKEIVQRALEKKPPFESEKKKSDSGFKDTLIYISIRENAFKNEKQEVTYILITNDKGFTEELENEFKSQTKKDLIIIPDVSKTQDVLDEKLKVGLERNKRRSEILKIIEENKYRLMEELSIARNKNYIFDSLSIWDFEKIEDNRYKVEGTLSATARSTENVLFPEGSSLDAIPLQEYSTAIMDDLLGSNILDVSVRGTAVAGILWNKIFNYSLIVDTAKEKIQDIKIE